ncbi:MAG TPA: DUF87 domain-containing protein, partial [Candidatus Pacearchaeota archaeon]|nr:DUF87 domain-containing protein [Candidatus Pacearchaeota archaeon]
QLKQSEKTVSELLNEISNLSKKLFSEKFGISPNMGYSEISKTLEAQKRPRISELCKRIEWALYSGEDIDKFEVEKLLQDLEKVIIQESQEERIAKESLKVETVKKEKETISELNRNPFDDSLLIGKLKSTSEDYHLDIDDLNTSTIIAGSTGSGKTIAAQVIAEEALLKNKSVIVFDSTSKWTGFLKKCDNQDMLKRYEYFGMNKKNAQAFRGSIKIIKDPYEVLNIKRHIHKNGEITIFDTSSLDKKSLELFISSSLEQIFQSNLEESKEFKSLIIYENVHTVLTRFEGSGDAVVQIDRAARNFKKWGLGLVLISQILKDLTKELASPVKTEIQLTTRYIGDLKRIKTIYGEEILNQIVNQSIGTAMIFSNDSLSNPEPYFVSFRPILHNKLKLTPKEIEWHNTQTRVIEDLEYQIVNLKKLGANVASLTSEISLLKENIKEQEFISVEAGLKSINKKIEFYWESVGKEPMHLPQKKIRKEVIQGGIEKSRRERAALDGGKHEAEARRIRDIIALRERMKKQKVMDKREQEKKELEELNQKAIQQAQLRRRLEQQEKLRKLKQPQKEIPEPPIIPKKKAVQTVKQIVTPKAVEMIPPGMRRGLFEKARTIPQTLKVQEVGNKTDRISESELRKLEQDILNLRKEIQRYNVHKGTVKEIIKKQKINERIKAKKSSKKK